MNNFDNIEINQPKGYLKKIVFFSTMSKWGKWGMQEVSGAMWLQFAIGHLTQCRFSEKSIFRTLT